MMPDDVGVIALMQMDADVMAHYGDGRPLSKESAEQTVLKYHVHCRAYDYWAWAVARLDTHEVLGQVTAGVEDANGPVVLGFILKRSAWGHGFGCEAVRAVINFGLRDLSWGTVMATVSPANPRSVRLCERIGMKKVGEHSNRRGDQRLIYVIDHKGSAPPLRA
jgi:RimJ/RimL family protein N-acetyltransferase